MKVDGLLLKPPLHLFPFAAFNQDWIIVFMSKLLFLSDGQLLPVMFGGLVIDQDAGVGFLPQDILYTGIAPNIIPALGLSAALVLNLCRGLPSQLVQPSRDFLLPEPGKIPPVHHPS